MVLVLVSTFALHFAFSESYQYPVPRVHDEFAYLLMGDTFAAGRLTNPTHPFWIHFETFHVLQVPVYQGKYPPGQGAFLALGQLLGGHPAVGVWLSMALAAAAVCWMLAALVPRAWAIAGALLFVVHFPVLQLWGQGYWGGAVAMLGSGLLFGGLARLRGGPSESAAWAMGAGLFVLANTRPMEGALAGILCLGPLLVWYRDWMRATPRPELARRVALPLALFCLATGLWVLYYNWRLTGNPFEMPHDLWRAREAVSPDVRAYHGSPERSLPGKLQQHQQFFVGNALSLALPFLLLRLRSNAVRFALVAVVLATAVSVFSSRSWPHYLAPFAGPMVFLLVEALRGLASSRVRGVALGRAAAVLIIALHVGLSLRTVGIYVARGPAESWYRERQAILEELEAREGEQLVLVRYPPDHDVHEEWVFNAADIDAAKVVWARDLGSDRNRGLLEHFAGREVWSLEVTPPFRLEPAERAP